MVSCELWSRQMARAAALKAANKQKPGAKR